MALRRFVERTVEVLHAAGFGPADASRAAASFIWFAVGRTVEEQTLPDRATILLGDRGAWDPVPRRGERDAPDVSSRFGVRIMVAGMRSLLP